MAPIQEPSHERAVTDFDPPVPDSPNFGYRVPSAWEPEARLRTDPAEETVPTAQSRTTHSTRLELDSFVVAAIGLAILTTGLIAITRGGFDGPMSDPVVEVLGFSHTTILGLIEIGFGGCILVSALASSRRAEVFFGIVLGVAGFVGSVQAESFQRSLALDSAMATLAVVAAVIVVLAALLLPRMSSNTTKVVRSH